MIGIFVLSEPDSTISTRKSAVCAYKMRDIRHKFTENIRECFGSPSGLNGIESVNIGGRRVGDQFSDRMCVTLGMQVNSSYCGEAEQNGPMVGTIGFEAEPLLQYTNTELTSIQAITASRHTIVALGTDTGTIKQVLLESEDKGREFEELSVDSTAIKQIELDVAKTHLYVMTSNKIIRLPVSDCQRFSTCDKCRSTSNPLCGWCSLQRRCTLRQQCTDGDEDKRWLGYEDWGCIHIPQQFINPVHIPFNTRVQVTVGIKSLPLLKGGFGYECVFGDNTSSSVATVGPNEIRCLTPSLSPNQHLLQQYKDHVNVTLGIRSTQTGVIFIDTQLTFYDCNHHQSCTSCNKAGWSCVWCISSHKCLLRNDDYDDDRVDDNDVDKRCSSNKIITASQKCPQLQHMHGTGQILLPAGVERAISLSTANLLSPLQTSAERSKTTSELDVQMGGGAYECLIHLTTPPLRVPAQRVSASLLVCLPHTYSYESDDSMKTVSIEVLWDGRYLIDDNYGTTVTVYRCDMMGRDCSSCVSLSESLDTSVYMCGWCGDFCAHNNTCATSSSTVSSLSSSSLSSSNSQRVKCPVHDIREITPLTGTSGGGTSITIKGTNLGRSVEQIHESVTVAGHPCHIISSQYIISNQIVCRTSSATNEGERGHIVVTLNGVSVTSEEIFTYQDPMIMSISPDHGPIDGGTRVTVVGRHLDTGGFILPLLGDLPCAPSRQNSTHLVCITPPVSMSVGYPITVRIDDVTLSTGVTFRYLENPTLTSVEPLSAYHSGGRVIIVKGERLNITQKPTIHLNSKSRTFSSQCVVKAANLLHCPSPSITKVGTRLIRSTGDRMTQQFSVSFTMDKVQTVTDLSIYYPHLSTTFTVYPDPVYHKFEEGTRIYRGEALILTGRNLDLACGLEEIQVLIGNDTCRVNSLDSTTLYCTPPNQQPQAMSQTSSTLQHGNNQLPIVKVIVGNLAYNLGYLEYQKVGQEAGFISDYWIMGMAVGGGTLLSIIVIILVIYKRKNSRAERQFKKLKLQLDSLESNIRNECKQAFAELQTEVSDFTSDLNVIGIPVWDYQGYLCRVLFPNQSIHHLLMPSDNKTVSSRSMGYEDVLNQFYQLLSSSQFLLLFIRTLEQQSTFTIKDKSTVASLLMVIFHSRLDYITQIVKTLLLDLIDKSVEKKHPKLMLRRTESVVEKLLSNWLSVCLYDHLKNRAAQPLFMLYKAIKHQTEKGPIDSVTLDARYSLSEDRLLREKLEPRSLLVYVTSLHNGHSGTISCKMLDCDTITQAKEKALDSIYMNTPFSKRPSVCDIDLEWQTSKKGCVTLRDEDNTSIRVKGWRRLNTLNHYHLPDGASLVLRPNNGVKINGYHPHSNNGYVGTLSGRSQPTTVTAPENGSRLFHLVKHDDGQQVGRTQKVISEIFLTRLLATKCTVQQYVDDLFTTILKVDSCLPPAIKYLFDFLDTAAHSHCLHDPQVLHTWKCNSLLLRFWVNIVKNPEFIFDINKSPVVDSCLSVITQTFMDACSTHEHRLGKDSPSSKLLYARDIPRYRQLVSRFYTDVHQMPPVTDQDMSRILAEHCMVNAPSLNIDAALKELFAYARTYNFEILEALDDDAIGRKLELSKTFEQTTATLNSLLYS